MFRIPSGLGGGVLGLVLWDNDFPQQYVLFCFFLLK